MLITQLKNILGKANNTMRNPVMKSMAIVAVLTFIIKIVAFYKETIVAGSFGLNEVIDTFIIASLLPTFINSVFISSLTNLFIPNYITELKNGDNKSSFQSVVFTMTIGVSLLSILITFFSFDFFLDIVYPNQPEANYQLVKSQFYIILPCLFFWGIESVLTGLLEVDNRFFISTIVGLLPLFTTILFLLHLLEILGPMVLAYGTLTGTIISFTFLLFYSIKLKAISLGKLILNSNSRLMIQQLPPKITSGFLSAMNNFIDQFFAGQLIVGSLAALSYANRIPAFGVSIVIMSLGNVLLPHFSRMVNEDLKIAYQYLFKILKWIFGTVLIASIIGILLSDWVIQLWLERNQFTHNDTIKVSTIQQILLLNVPFYLCTLIIVKFLTSINKNSFMAWISLVNLIVNIILNTILIKHYGVFGLAMSTSLVFIISSCFYFGYTYKLYKKLNL
ncbi:murein biosynthesis integral membrane protein MurJ [Gelidibacter pelagius]|uniref:Polysaccharide biosynthesis C-terminal domain-containing protein n=1 Tax=Gelidibacter pelagius TaxID=2819985 RepID=A0ABS3SQE6_9FLAO|nr:lipid II flippase MurJ [Gelidibacter pelagius]MBO3097920.1 polysaccharide biosynthesis C-terminal domain-containing protein [Gelidibacter pelagius]